MGDACPEWRRVPGPPDQAPRRDRVTAFRYPGAGAVVVGLCPPPGWEPEPVFGERPSVSATRMDTTMPGWREHLLGANAWWTHWEWHSRAHSSRVTQILEEARPRLVVALGREVQRELGVRSGPYFEEQVIPTHVGDVRVLLFPHPSGLCRVWNEPENREAATRSLERALEDL